MQEGSTITVQHDPRDNFLGEFEGALKPSDFARGRFTQFIEYMMVHRERSPEEVVLEYSAPINFLYDGMEMPTDGIWNSSEKQKD